MQFSNRLIGLAALIGALAIFAGTFGFREVPGQQFGAAFFPRITAVALAVTGLALMIPARRQPWVALPEWMRSARGVKAAALPLGGLAWLLAAPSLGFLLTTFLLILVLVLIAGGRLLSGTAVALALSGMLFTIFGLLLRIPLPYGVIERWLL